MIDIPSDPKRTEREDRLCHADDEPCLICGRPLKSKAIGVLTICGASIVTREEYDQANESARTGVYHIGPDCLKKHPAIQPYVIPAQAGIQVDAEPPTPDDADIFSGLDWSHINAEVAAARDTSAPMTAKQRAQQVRENRWGSKRNWGYQRQG